VRKSFFLLPLILLVGACRTGAKSAHPFKAPVGDTSGIVAGIDTTGITKAQVEALLAPMVVQIAQQAQQTGQSFDVVAAPLRRQATAQLLIQDVVSAEAAKQHLVPEWHAKGRAALAVMESHLATHDWFAGGAYSIADIALYAYTHSAADGGFELSEFPRVTRWLSRVAGMPDHITLEAH